MTLLCVSHTHHRECPDLLRTIEKIAKVGGASDDRGRLETI